MARCLADPFPSPPSTSRGYHCGHPHQPDGRGPRAAAGARAPPPAPPRLSVRSPAHHFSCQVYGTRHTTVSSVVKTLVAQEGVTGFMKGVSARITSMAPTSVLVVTAYETVKRLSQKTRAPASTAGE